VVKFNLTINWTNISTKQSREDRYALTPNKIELIPALGALFIRGGPVQDPVLTNLTWWQGLRRGSWKRGWSRWSSTSPSARPIHQIISMIKWIRTSGLSIKNSLPHLAGSRVSRVWKPWEPWHCSSQFLPLEPFSPEAGPSRTRSSHRASSVFRCRANREHIS